jgi:hypothetical protein
LYLGVGSEELAAEVGFPLKSTNKPMATALDAAGPDMDRAIKELELGAQCLAAQSPGDRRALVDECAARISLVAEPWVLAACSAKRIAVDQPIAGEEILAGPACVLRYLRLLSSTLNDLEQHGEPQLPGRPRRNRLGWACVPILPVRSLYDHLVFRGLEAEVWMPEDSGTELLFSSSAGGGKREPGVAGILGAGNVSAIPATDMLHKIFHDSKAVLLKLNPVNEYLEPLFEDAFRPLINAGLLRIIRGDNRTGSDMVHHPGIGSIHITGSHLTHEAIVWGTDPSERRQRRHAGRPLVDKLITSELGNVTPWIMVPGKYSRRQLRSQAEHVVASIVNNASFNCLATRMIVTARSWSQRNEFLDLIESLLENVPPRYAYYPGAIQRFEKATGRPAPRTNGDILPWVLIRDARPDEAPYLFEEESFVGVCAETAIDESSDTRFLDNAVEFVNERIFGTLCASITMPHGFASRHSAQLDQAIARMRYGSVSINQWSGVVYGLMTPPWGGYPGSTIETPESGIGHVHNTFFLSRFDKTVLRGPLCNFPKPAWFPSHRTCQQTAWSLLHLYEKPSLQRLPSLFWHALRG